MVKPILKKLSCSEKNSLDLDRGWDEQPQMAEWSGGDGAYGGGTFYHPTMGAGKSARDISFEISGRGSLSLAREGAASSTARKTFQVHGRSTSGNSHHSVATNGSGGVRIGTFVHPFQQLPRTSTSTPPLTYANSMASLDNGTAQHRDYSPTITENEDDGDVHGASQSLSGRTSSHFHLNQHYSATHAQPAPAHGIRRPSLASQRTSSLTDITSAITSSTPNLRLNTTGRSTPTLPASRLAPSKSDLHLNLSSLDSPTGSTRTGSTPVLKSSKTAPSIVSPSSSSTPMSPLRTSLEAMGIPRLRSHSEVDTAARQEHIRKARRKFEERERAKNEKYDLEQVRKRNRKETKEATRIEKERQDWYKATGVSNGAGFGVGSVNNSKANLSSSLAGTTILETSTPTSGGRPSVSRKHTPTNFSTLSTTASVPTAGSRSSSGTSKVFGKRKESFPGAGSQARSSSGLHDITTSRKSSGFERGDSANDGNLEKRQAFAARNYESVPGQNPPIIGPAAPDEGPYPYPQMPSRKKQAKRKTQSAWYGFVMWIRAKMLHMSGR